MLKKLSVLSTILIAAGCSSVTKEPVVIDPFVYEINASKNDLYFASVDCTLENITVNRPEFIGDQFV